MLIWMAAVFFAFLIEAGIVLFLIHRASTSGKRKLKKITKRFEEEIAIKKRFLEEMAKLSKGMIRTEELEEIKSKHTKTGESLRAEKGKVAIAEAEMESVDLRLRELCELQRELELSTEEASKEIEMLRSQQDNIKDKNTALNGEINRSGEKIQYLLQVLSDSAVETQQLTEAKAELSEFQKQIEFYEKAIATVNDKYVELKQAYDALDIEYAQFYEKQQMRGG